MDTPARDDALRIADLPHTLRALAVDRLRGAIIAGRFRSGERLVERSLCDQLGVSRSVVREAIRYLEAEGLVEIAPRSGPVVARLDWPRAAQIYQIRRLLESAAAADCARVAGPEVKAALTRAQADIAAAHDAAEPDRLYAATTRFYELIFRAAGHDIAWEIVQRLNSRISRLRALTLASTDRAVPGPTRMARIASAIAANAPGAAARAVESHLTEAAEIARALLDPKAAP